MLKHGVELADISQSLKNGDILPLSKILCGLFILLKKGNSYYFESEVSQLKYEFRRIGSYDFTKKEKKKIKNLVKPQWSMPVEDLIDKINELVDAVNKLMDKENKE